MQPVGSALAALAFFFADQRANTLMRPVIPTELGLTIDRLSGFQAATPSSRTVRLAFYSSPPRTFRPMPGLTVIPDAATFTLENGQPNNAHVTKGQWVELSTIVTELQAPNPVTPETGQAGGCTGGFIRLESFEKGRSEVATLSGCSGSQIESRAFARLSAIYVELGKTTKACSPAVLRQPESLADCSWKTQ